MTRNAAQPQSLHRLSIGYSHGTMTDDIQHGRPLAIDATAKSDPLTEPAFISPPERAPVYDGFVVLDEVPPKS